MTTRPGRPSDPRTLAALSALALLLACTGSSPLPTNPTLPPETILTTPPGTAPTASSPTTTTTTGSTTAAPDPVAWPEAAPSVLVATGGGILLGSDPYAAAGTPVVGAVDDLAGGVVFQTEAGDLWWVPVDSQESIPLSAPGEFQESLHQVAEVDGERVVVVTRRYESQQAEPEEHLEVVVLGGQGGPGRRLAVTGGIEWGAQSVSYAAGTFLVTEVNHSCGEMRLLGPTGEPLAAPGLPEPPCRVHFEVPFAHGRLSPDGSLLAYVAQTFAFNAALGYPVQVSSDVVVAELATGEELVRERVTDTATERVISMDFDGEWLVWARQPPGDEPGGTPTGSEVFGLHLDGTRFRASVEGVRAVWLPRAPLTGTAGEG